MTTFQELDAYLSQEFSDDYWYDDAKFYACELVKQLTTDDWNTLKSSWRNRPKQWQERCAEILDWGDARQAVPLLVEMIQVEDDELTLTAADSLSSIGVAELDLAISADVLSRLQALANSGNVAKLIINQLLGQLEVKAYHDFFIEVLQATEESGVDPQVVYPLLEANQQKLNENFANVLRDWLTATLPEVEPEEAYGIAAAVGNFCHLIQQFPHGNQSNNIEIAIAGYEVVSTVITHEVSREEWAMIQDDLGNAYCDRIEGDWAENMEKAIAAFQSALQGYTHEDEDFREDWARTQNNLATVYSDRIRGDQAENLELAIACCENALQVYSRQVLPDDWAMVQTNLGAAYRKRIRGDKAENLEAAIRCYKAALEEHTRERFPEDWAGLQNNLGNAYRERIQGDRAENLEQALSCFNTALEVYTRESFPQDWAMLQNNFALTYYDKGHIELAITCFQAALEICTPSTFPYDCLQYGGNLGDKAFAAGFWLEAIEGYRVAIEVIEQIRAWVSTETRRQEILQESFALYENIVKACINTNQLDKAVKYVECSKAYNLVELLADPGLYPTDDIPEYILNELPHLRQEIPVTEKLLESTPRKLVRGMGEDRPRRIKLPLQEAIAA
jgi:tetratricopeptide (TPR) repeat protein